MDKTPWTRERFATLPAVSKVTRHVCVEGWDYIGQWDGPTLRTFLEQVGADKRAKYVAFKTADDYPSSIDMGTALHPQTLLATGYAGETLPDPFGYPLRAEDADQAGVQAAEVDHGDRGYQYLSEWVLGEFGVQLV